jgi:hypothetical protein
VAVNEGKLLLLLLQDSGVEVAGWAYAHEKITITLSPRVNIHQNLLWNTIQPEIMTGKFRQRRLQHLTILTLKSAESLRERSSSSMNSLASFPSSGSSVLLQLRIVHTPEFKAAFKCG